MITQHTPGNWIAFQTENQANVGQWSIGLEHSNPICHGVGKGDAYMLLSGVCSETDARLFAAAPDLLKALLPLVECMPVGGGMVRFDGDELAAARAAIAKVRGQ